MSRETREPSTPADFDAEEARDEARHAPNARHIPAHEHYYANQGRVLMCWCGETVTWDEAEP